MKFQVKIQNKNFNVTIENIDCNPIIADVDGEQVEVWLDEEKETIAATTSKNEITPKNESAPQPTTVENTSGDIKAPIPGVIIDILVKPGEEVTIGQEVCILEAMKMKNSIRANRKGTVEDILVKPGDQVAHNQVLIQFKK